MSTMMFLLMLTSCVVFVAMGVPFVMSAVPPNRIYGFRIRRTLQDPEVWYAANRVAGLWSVGTGIVAAAVSIATFALGVRFVTAAILDLVPFILGIAGMLVHVFRVIRHVVDHRQKSANG